MTPLTVLTGVAAPMPLINIDTDMIIPGQYVKVITKDGLGVGLFHNLRYLPDGSDNPEFILNRQPWRAARIIIAGRNFGPGSSREHAPWALADYGIRCVVSSLFADIFFTNAINSGVLPITLPQEQVDVLMADAADPASATMTVDLPRQQIVRAHGTVMPFDIDAALKKRLVEGLDDLDVTLLDQPAIDAFVARRRATQPWL